MVPDARGDDSGVTPVHIRFFPTARPVAVDLGVAEVTPDGRTRSIEFLLADAGDPGQFDRRRAWCDVRAEAGPGVEWPGIDLSRDDLSGFDLRWANLTGAVLGAAGGSDFRHARLDRARIADAQGSLFGFSDLHEACFDCGRLEGASFDGALLGGASFRDASLRRARFFGADLTQVDFTGADLTGSDVESAAAAEGADFSEAMGLSIEQQRALALLGAVGVDRTVPALPFSRERSA